MMTEDRRAMRKSGIICGETFRNVYMSQYQTKAESNNIIGNVMTQSIANVELTMLRALSYSPCAMCTAN